MTRVVMPRHVDLLLVLNALEGNVVLAHASSRVQVPHAGVPVDSVTLKKGVLASRQNVPQMCTFKMAHHVTMISLIAFLAAARHMMHSVKNISEQVSMILHTSVNVLAQYHIMLKRQKVSLII